MMLATSRTERRSHAGDATEKRSLASILRDHGPIPVTDAVDIALDICDELASAHANGIVHGDLGMHRVRTHWPRVRGQRVDIFALGENDSAAFAFRATAVAGLVAPEQRDNRPVDIRADVWAVGAMLHWMIAGAAPGADPAARTLAKAPRTLAVTIEACLAVDPTKRPQSVDELSEVIASFASSPPDRFEQLASRRSSTEKTKRVRSDLGDVDRVLGRLDDAALQRELAAATTPSPPDAGALDRLMIAVHQSTGSAIFEKSVPMIDLADLADEQENIETVVAEERYVPGAVIDEAIPPVASPLSIAPVVLSSELLAPPTEPKPDVPIVMTAPLAIPASPVARTAPVAMTGAGDQSSKRPWTIALGIVGATLALSLGVGIGMRLVERAVASHAAVSSPANAPISAGAPAPEVQAASSLEGTSPKVEPTVSLPATAAAAAVITPDSLPDALPVTPASLPDAKPSGAIRTSAPRANGASTTSEASPSSLSDALR